MDFIRKIEGLRSCVRAGDAWRYTLHLMNMLKLSVAASLAFVLLMPVSAQQSGNSNVPAQRRDKIQSVTNRPPIINSFKASTKTAPIPCPSWDDPISIACSGAGDYTVTFTTDAYDPDGDTLLYKYSIREGKISGEGASVVWDYTGLARGPYVAKVEVSDQRGHVRSRVVKVELVTCDCLPPCPSLNLSAPEFVNEGQAVTINAEVFDGPRNLELTPKWIISEGTITNGQGTYAITVNTEGLAGKKFKVMFEVDGAPPECNRKASTEIEVRK